MSRRADAWGFASIAALAAMTSVAHAAPAPSYADLLAQASTAAPRLMEGEADLRTARGQAKQAGAWSNPTLNYEVENFGNVAGGPLSERQTTWTLTQPIELGGERWSRAAAGRFDVKAAEARRIQSQADFAYDLAMTYALAEAGRTRAKLLEDDLLRSNENARAARAFVDAGKEADLSAVQAESAAAGAEADLQLAKADYAEALARLSSLAGSTEPFTDVGGSLLMLAGVAKAPPTDLPGDAPMVVIAEAQREAAIRRTWVERGRVIPNVDLSFGARTLEGQPDTALVAGVSAQLPLFNWNQGSIAAAKGQEDAAAARARAARLDVEANWRAAAMQLSASQSRIASAGKAEAAARDGYQLTQIGYEAGKASLLQLLSARRALNEAQSRSLDARLAGVRAEAMLARLAGRTPFGDKQ